MATQAFNRAPPPRAPLTMIPMGIAAKRPAVRRLSPPVIEDRHCKSLGGKGWDDASFSFSARPHGSRRANPARAPHHEDRHSSLSSFRDAQHPSPQDEARDNGPIMRARRSRSMGRRMGEGPREIRGAQTGGRLPSARAAMIAFGRAAPDRAQASGGTVKGGST
jgi:hypothetical protein